MAQAAMPASPFISTALYIRLSVEDNNKRGNLSKRKSWFSKNSYWENLNCVFMTFISTMEQQERISTVTASNGCFRILNPAKWAV